MAHLLTLLGSADLTNLPLRYLSSLSRNGHSDNIVGMVIRIVIVGALVAGARRAFGWAHTKISRALFPTAYISVGDASYLWVMAWISTDPEAQRQIQDFQLSTSEWRQVRQRSGNALRAGSREGPVGVGEHSATWTSKEIIGQVIPTYHQSIRIKHDGTYIWITRKMGLFARSRLRTVDHIQIQTIALKPNAIKNFLVAAHQAYFAKEEQELLIFHPMRIQPAWQKPVSRPSRPWSSVILPGTMKEDVLRDMEKFLSDKEMNWYAARGIPHRRGYLFHGTPGAGKTTLATALASKLRLDIYVINPSQRGMDDAKLSKLFRDCPAKSIILIEDIDCIFPRIRSRNILTVEEGDEEAMIETPIEAEPERPPASPMVGGSHDLAPSTVTLSGLLNAIDGVSSQEGCILIASTNHPERLDPALGRAGRFDVKISFQNATPDQARALFLHFYPLSDFVQTPDGADKVMDEKTPVGIASQTDLDSLADDFAGTIFAAQEDESNERSNDPQVSMAALQGYLLRYKEDPQGALDHASDWVKSMDKEAMIPTRSSLAPPPTPVGTGSPAVGDVPLRKRVLKKNKAQAEGANGREDFQE